MHYSGILERPISLVIGVNVISNIIFIDTVLFFLVRGKPTLITLLSQKPRAREREQSRERKIRIEPRQKDVSSNGHSFYKLHFHIPVCLPFVIGSSDPYEFGCL